MSSPSYKYGSGVVLYQSAGSRSSPSVTNRSTTDYSTQSSSSMGSSNNSSSTQSGYQRSYRSGNSVDYHTDVRQSRSRNGTEVVVINHRKSSPTVQPRSAEPHSSDYYQSSRSSQGSRSSR